MIRNFSVFFFLLIAFVARSQDKIVLMNGKVIPVKSISLTMYDIKYRTLEKNKLRKIDPERVFSLQYADGTERVIFLHDSTDTLEYTIPQMRMFIKGEQDAMVFYNNKVNKGAAFLIGGGASLFAIYGLVIPPIYATIAGRVYPDIEKMEVSDPRLLSDPDYTEGYIRKAHDRKVRNALVSGFIGFATGFVALAVIHNNF